MKISFRSVDEFEGWYKFPAFIEETLSAHSAKRVCEIGAGANPALTPDMIHRHSLEFRAIDEVATELQKSGMIETLVYDVCGSGTPVPGAPYDLIFSRMAAEHFRDPRNAYRNIYEALAPGGLSIHCFATLYSLPFLLNRFLPDRLSDFVWSRFAPRDRERHDKFKAYYSHCRGPIQSQILFFHLIGFEIVEYRGYFGHNYYAPRLPLLHVLNRQAADLLLKTRVAALTSYATVVLRKPQ